MTTNEDSQPLVSIVTPSFNAMPFLREAIESVLTQDYVPIEHIVIDGGSKDSTVDLLRTHPRVVWVSEPDDGQADALNKGFRMARGEIIGWLNADDTYTRGAVSAAVRCLAANPDVNLVYSDCNRLDAEGKPLAKYKTQPYSLKALVFSHGLIHTPAVFWRRSLFDAVGYLDERYHYSLDNEFWLRACPVANPRYVDHTLANFHRRTGSKTASTEAEFVPEMVEIYERILREEPYALALSAAEKRYLLGRLHWTSGVVLWQNDQPERARPYLKAAVEEYGMLGHPAAAAYPLTRHFLTGELWPEGTVQAMLEALPLAGADAAAFRRSVWQEYYASRFFLAHGAGDWPGVRRGGLQAVQRRPGWLLQRGFLSIWLRSFLRWDLGGRHVGVW